MRSPHFMPLVAERKGLGSCLCSLVSVTALLSMIYLLVSSYVDPEHREREFTWGLNDVLQSSNVGHCKNRCRPTGSEPLPEGIVENTSNLQMRPLWGFPENENTSLFAVAVGIKQKDLVDKMVNMFLSSGFVIMLFHYDGIVDEWKKFEWCDKVIHVSALNQTKWWFAKRFLHPDIVSEYSYIFLWDEDLGVDNFHPKEYVSIVEHEGLEISQPALDYTKSEVHHQITAREGNSVVHRRIQGANGKHCDGHSKAPPCTGWIEMMAPVFSRAAWRCVWYMIQNDLIHAWGIDRQVGYCAQGDRTKNIGIVDAEYIVHHNRPTLGVPLPAAKNHSVVEGRHVRAAKNHSIVEGRHVPAAKNHSTIEGRRPDKGDRTKSVVVNPEYIARHYPKIAARYNITITIKGRHRKKNHSSHLKNPRVEVRRQSYVELYLFNLRWEKAVKNDKCWVNPYH